MTLPSQRLPLASRRWLDVVLFVLIQLFSRCGGSGGSVSLAASSSRQPLLPPCLAESGPVCWLAAPTGPARSLDYGKTGPSMMQSLVPFPFAVWIAIVQFSGMLTPIVKPYVRPAFGSDSIAGLCV